MKTPLFKGSCTAIITPFNDTGIDYERLAKNIDYQFESGTSALVVCGTTGENATLTENEHNELVRFAVQHAAGRMKIIAGVGSNNTLTALKYAQNAKYAGADGILMVTPYYNKTTQKGIAEHFSYVADRVDIPMILYNVPSRTAIGISADTYKQLSAHPNINGIKEASGNFSLIGEVRAKCGEDLNIWSGNDSDTVPMMAMGALGVISVASNIVPSAVAKLCDLCLNGDYPGAMDVFTKYAAFFADLFIETNPIPIKAAMQLTEADSGKLRLPLVSISDEALGRLKNTMREIGLI